VFLSHVKLSTHVEVHQTRMKIRFDMGIMFFKSKSHSSVGFHMNAQYMHKLISYKENSLPHGDMNQKINCRNCYGSNI